MPSSTEAAAVAKSVPKLNVVIRWSADPQQICRLLSIIKSNPLWRQACFPQSITTVTKLYKIYIDIFLVFCKDDPAIKAAEREGLVQRVKGSGAKNKWEATERFSSRVGNPVRRKIESLKSALKSGTYTSTHKIRPSWKRWGDVPNDIRATFQAEHPYYFQLLELAQSSFNFVLPPRSANVEARQSGRKRKLQPSLDVEDDRGPRVGNHKRPRIAADDSGNDDTEPPASRRNQPPSSVPVLSPRWDRDPQEICRLFDVIRTNDLWRQACFPRGGASASANYKVYIEIFLRVCKDDPVMEVAAREGLVKRLGGGNGGKSRWIATDKFDSQVENPVRTKTSSLMNDFVTGIYQSDHGFHPSWKKWTDMRFAIRDDLQALHPYYFQLRNLLKPSLKVIRKRGLAIEGEAAHVSKSERAAADPSTSRLYEDDCTLEADNGVAPGDTQPISTVPVLSPSWTKKRKTDTYRLLRCIGKSPRWRQTCFGPKGSTSDSSIYKTTCLEIFLFFFKDDPVMTHAETEGLVIKVDGGNGEKPWAATKKFGIIGLVNPVETKLTSLKRDFSAGLYHSHHGFDPNWNSWQDVPDHMTAVLKGKHRYYFKLRSLIDEANPPSVSKNLFGKVDVEAEAKVKRVGKGKRAAVPPHASSSAEEDMTDAGDEDDDTAESEVPKRKDSPAPLPVSVPRKRQRVLPPDSPSRSGSFSPSHRSDSEDSSVVFLEQRNRLDAGEETMANPG
ncbi:hypothetical protein B9479_007780 [Cryptococcus floricola]|uniref:Uncharacterized protein n=1 Tax=Cryptococcus floricola TaxID=2591691 RepID=A0A5D3APP9_9TREE|nr:hypothetical protein B9479_007780 [Cryptococcus floricola]